MRVLRKAIGAKSYPHFINLFVCLRVAKWYIVLTLWEKVGNNKTYAIGAFLRCKLRLLPRSITIQLGRPDGHRDALELHPIS